MKRLLLILMIICLFPMAGVMAQGQQPANCIVTPLQLRGQAHLGLTGASGGSGNPGDDAVQMSWMADAATAITPGSEAVAIVIVDEFPPSQQANNANRPLTHGQLVRDVLEQALEALGSPTNISLVEVNIAAGQSGRYQTNTVARELQSAIEDLQEEGISRFVINMSFALVPCTDGSFSHQRLVNQHSNNPNTSLESLVGEDAAVTLLEKPSDDSKLDPLHDLLSDLLAQNGSDDFALIAVASAGNFGEDAPFYPAGWEQVISVSGSLGSGADAERWEFSNSGDVMVPGAWFLFSDDQYRGGTSFSAPLMSLVAALELSSSDSGCNLSTETAPLTNLGEFDNQPYSDALDC